MGATEKPAAEKPKILMRRTGSSRPLDKAATPKPKGNRTAAGTAAGTAPGKAPAKVVKLDGPRTLEAWAEQTKRMAAGLNCLDALLVRETIPRGEAPRSEAEWLRKLRTETALHIIFHSVTAPVFAYMRVLGHNSICGRNAAETYEFARLAAGRMDLVMTRAAAAAHHGGGMEEEEVDRMVWEWQFNKRENYPAEVSYDQAMAWLRRVLERRAESDGAVREILEAFALRDRARGGDDRCEPGVPEDQVGGVHPGQQPTAGRTKQKKKRKGRDDEALESPGVSPSSRQSEERTVKRPRSSVMARESECGGPLVSRPKHPPVPGPPKSSTQQGSDSRPQKLDDRTTDPKPRPQLETITLPWMPRIGSISVSSIGGVPREELFDTGLLSPDDMKVERLGS